MKRIALFGTSANPPGLHHKYIVEALSQDTRFDQIMVIPCGPRTDGKLTVNDTAPIHRATMCDLEFGRIASHVTVDLSDLERRKFSKTWELEKRYECFGEVWHVVGTDLIKGGASDNAAVKSWEHGKTLWNQSRFIIVERPEVEYDKNDLPPHHILIHGINGSSTEIRRNAFEHLGIKGRVSPVIEEYIKRFGLYRDRKDDRRIFVESDSLRILFVVNEHSEEAMRRYQEVREYEDQIDPSIIVTIGGDGTMIHAIQEHWRKRIPFLGINAGHEGFLLNRRVSLLGPSFFNQKFVLRSSPLLHITAHCADGTVKESLAVNDAWLQTEMGKTGWFSIYVNGKKKFFGRDVVADAVLVATAAGSSAYARCMGATPMHFSEGKLVLVGSNVYKPSSWRQGSYLYRDNTEVRIVNSDPSGWRKLYGFADNTALGEVSEMTIRLSNIASADLLFTSRNDREKIDKYRFPRN